MLDKSRMSDDEWREYWVEYWKTARNEAEGRWGSVLTNLAPQLSPAVDAQGKRHVACPVHGGKDGFRVYKDFESTGGGHCNTCGGFHDGFSLLQWANGWDARTSVEEVMTHLKGGQGKAKPQFKAPPVKTPASNKPDNQSLRNSLNRVWMQTLSMEHRDADPARRYLARRGLSIQAPEGIRFHPSLGYHDGDKMVGYYPAIVAVVMGANGQPVTLHRTYLTREGQKAPVASPKKLMMYPDDRKIVGGAIHLVKHARVLGVAEGIESALAAIQGTGIPTWSTVNALMLESFVPPAGVEQLIVFVDKDKPTKPHPKGHGQEAAMKLVQRAWAMGIKATAIVPKGEIPEGEKSLDWLDILQRDGMSGFPSLASVRLAMLRAA